VGRRSDERKKSGIEKWKNGSANFRHREERSLEVQRGNLGRSDHRGLWTVDLTR
jgi:hypothetical protein